jgi:hypothetical protein
MEAFYICTTPEGAPGWAIVAELMVELRIGSLVIYIDLFQAKIVQLQTFRGWHSEQEGTIVPELIVELNFCERKVGLCILKSRSPTSIVNL